ncbi:MAG: hypothetical protein ACRDUA_00035 [Micromonosporaceae bacterium]
MTATECGTYPRVVLFEKRLREGIATGQVTVAFRRWRRRQAVPGGRYRTGADGGRLAGGSAIVQVDAVDIVAESDVTAAEATAAGYGSVAELLASLRGDPERPLYRIRFHRVDEPDPRAELAASAELTDSDVAAVDRRLDRMDSFSSYGPWTAATLAAIAERPGVVAAELATSLERDTLPFKRDVRKLKELGLTISLAVGYRLSPRGAAYLRRTGRGSFR